MPTTNQAVRTTSATTGGFGTNTTNRGFTGGGASTVQSVNASLDKQILAAIDQAKALVAKQGKGVMGKPGDTFYVDESGQAYVAQKDMFGRPMDPMPLEPGQLYMHPDGRVTIQGRTGGGAFGNSAASQTRTLTAAEWAEQLSRDESFVQGFAPILKVLAPAILPGITQSLGNLINGPTSVLDPTKLGLDALNTFDTGVMDQVLNNGVQGASQLVPSLANAADPFELLDNILRTTGAETATDAAKQLGYDSFERLVNDVNPSWLSDTAISQIINPTTTTNPTTQTNPAANPSNTIDPTKAAGTAAAGAAAANAANSTNPLSKFLKDTFGLDIGDSALTTLGNLLKTGIGLYGADQAADSAKELADRFDSYGAPYRQKLTDLYANPDAFLRSNEVQKPVQMATDMMARSLSTQGNPTGSGRALQQLQSYSADQLFGKIGQEKDRLAGFGGLANYNAAAPAAAANASNADNSYLNVLGAGVADIFSPPKTYQSLYDLLNRRP